MAGRTLIGPHRSDMEATYKEKGISAKTVQLESKGDAYINSIS